MNEIKIFTCPFCDYTIPDLRKRNKHIIKKHSDKVDIIYDDQGIWRCWTAKKIIDEYQYNK